MYKFIGATFFVAVLIAASIPAWVPLMPKLEGHVAPVLSKLSVSVVEGRDRGNQAKIDGVVLYISFDKKRQCEFLSISWRDMRTGAIYPFLPDNLDGRLPETQPTGRVTSGPWTLRGAYTTDIRHLEVTTVHKCHPFWLTLTTVWP